MKNNKIKISKSGLRKLSDEFLEISDELKLNRENYKVLLDELLNNFVSNEIEGYINNFYNYELDSLNIINEYMKLYSSVILKRLNNSIYLNNADNYKSMSNGNKIEIYNEKINSEYCKETSNITISNKTTHINYNEVLEIIKNLIKEFNKTKELFNRIISLEKYIESKEIWDGPSCDSLIESLTKLTNNFDGITLKIENMINALQTFNENYHNKDNTNINDINTTLINW